MRNLRRRTFALTTASLTCLGMSFVPSARAQQNTYPSKPIHLILGFVPGGGADILGRVVAKNLSVALNSAVVVENHPGANGNIASDRVAHSAPDGYTLMVVTAPNVINASLYRHLDYDPIKDFAPVIALASVPMVLTVGTASPIQSVHQLIDAAKANPEQLSFSSGGIGSLEHLSGLRLEQAAGISLTHVPYKGSGESLTDLVGGRISLAFNSMPSVLPFIHAGRLRALAVGDTERSPLLPTIPTMTEAGVAGFARENWYGVVAPAGTSPGIITKLNGELSKVLQLKDMQDFFARLGATAIGGGPEQFGQFEADEAIKYAKLVKTFNLSED